MCLTPHFTPSRSTAHQLSHLSHVWGFWFSMHRNVSFITPPETSWYPDLIDRFSLSLCLCRSRRKEAAQHCPEEHRDGPGRRDAKPNDPTGQPRIHWRQHEQLQLWGKVSNKTHMHTTILKSMTVCHACFKVLKYRPKQIMRSSSCNFLIKTFFFILSLIFPGVRLSSDSQFSDFLDGLGPAQLVGRQTLATPPMGEHLFIWLSVYFAIVLMSPVKLSSPDASPYSNINHV